MNIWRLSLLLIIIIFALIFLTYSPVYFPPRHAIEEKQPTEEESYNLKSTLATDELIFCSDPWPPYAGYAGTEHEGYIIDILREIFEPSGYKVQYINVPWSRCIRDTRDGVITALAGADIDEVPDFVFPEETIGITRPAFFVRSDNKWNFQGIKSLENIKLGSIQDYTYEAELDEYIRRYQDTDRTLIVKGNDALIRLITAVQTGRVGTLIENAPVVYDTLRQMGINPGELKEAGAPKIGVRLFVPFSPKFVESRKYTRIFDRRILELRESGRLRSILAVYEINDWLDEGARINRLQSQK